MSITPLPIDEVLPALVSACAERSAVVLHAPTGAGKTTRVPGALIDAALFPSGKIVMTEPRRVAVRAAATRICDERGTELGGETGYIVRFDKKMTAQTRILVVTDGVLVRMLQDDPFCEQIAAIVFDEFHERSLFSDLALGLALRIQREIKPELKIIVMSATLDAEPIAEFLDDAPVVRSRGFLHPVEVRHFPPRADVPQDAEWMRAVSHALEHDAGDILVFLPGVGEIFRLRDQLSPRAQHLGVEIQTLFGEMPLEEQTQVLKPGPVRRVVLATNVAESSVTIPRIRIVIDTGLSRTMRLDNATSLNRLELGRISRSSAEQRKGRAGRTEPGVCYRLWHQADDRKFADFDTPEILRVDLAGVALELFAFGESNPSNFPWFSPPAFAAWTSARELLAGLGAIDGDTITPFGRQLSEMPLHPRLAALVLHAAKLGFPELGCTVAAVLSERDFVRKAVRRERIVAGDSDIDTRLDALSELERGQRLDRERFDVTGMRSVLRVARELVRSIPRKILAPSADTSVELALNQMILAGFPDRVAKRRAPEDMRGRMVGGRGVVVSEESIVMKSDLFVCLELAAGSRLDRSDSPVRIAHGIRTEDLPSASLRSATSVRFDPASGRVESFDCIFFRDLNLRERRIATQPGPVVSEALFDATASDPESALHLDESARNVLCRIQTLRRAMPEIGLPDPNSEFLREVLRTACEDCRSISDLQGQPAARRILEQLTYVHRQALDREAPAALGVPSGRELPLQYRQDAPPLLAAKIQEMFGLMDTPRIAGGRLPVVMSLLAPNQRPQQLTSDLRGFWANTYPEIRKELKPKYPKHDWPEDPWTAIPSRGVRRKQT